MKNIRSKLILLFVFLAFGLMLCANMIMVKTINQNETDLSIAQELPRID